MTWLCQLYLLYRALLYKWKFGFKNCASVNSLFIFPQGYTRLKYWSTRQGRVVFLVYDDFARVPHIVAAPFAIIALAATIILPLPPWLVTHLFITKRGRLKKLLMTGIFLPRSSVTFLFLFSPCSFARPQNEGGKSHDSWSSNCPKACRNGLSLFIRFQ